MKSLITMPRRSCRALASIALPVLLGLVALSGPLASQARAAGSPVEYAGSLSDGQQIRITLSFSDGSYSIEGGSIGAMYSIQGALLGVGGDFQVYQEGTPGPVADGNIALKPDGSASGNIQFIGGGGTLTFTVSKN